MPGTLLIVDELASDTDLARLVKTARDPQAVVVGGVPPTSDAARRLSEDGRWHPLGRFGDADALSNIDEHAYRLARAFFDYRSKDRSLSDLLVADDLPLWRVLHWAVSSAIEKCLGQEAAVRVERLLRLLHLALRHQRPGQIAERQGGTGRIRLHRQPVVLLRPIEVA